MKIKLPYGYTLNINFDVRLTPPPVYYLYLRAEDGDDYGFADKSTSYEMMEFQARRLLQMRYGATDTWDTDNGGQWIHPKSPNARKSGSPLVDAFISQGEARRD